MRQPGRMLVRSRPSGDYLWLWSKQHLLLGVALLVLSATPDMAESGQQLQGRAHVIDGDTIVVSGIHVRLKGIAAPEVPHPGQAEAEPGGLEARDFLRRLVEGRTVVCRLTNERSHGRRVGWCERDGEDLGGTVVSAGLARDCPRYSGGSYAAVETAASRKLPFPAYCTP